MRDCAALRALTNMDAGSTQLTFRLLLHLEVEQNLDALRDYWRVACSNGEQFKGGALGEAMVLDAIRRQTLPSWKLETWKAAIGPMSQSFSEQEIRDVHSLYTQLDKLTQIQSDPGFRQYRTSMDHERAMREIIVDVLDKGNPLQPEQISAHSGLRVKAIPGSSLKVFLCHSSNDKEAVRTLYGRLYADGFEPWLDEENLLPGQEWELEIEKAVRSSDAVIVCLSRSSITGRGYVQKEIKYALDVADEQPEGSIFLIPAKLEECEVPNRLQGRHWVNLFETAGYGRLVLALNNCGSRSQLIGKQTDSALERIEKAEPSPRTPKPESSTKLLFEKPSKTKIEEYDAETQEIAFTLEIFEDPEKKEFVGHLSGHKPPLLQEVKPGEAYPVLRLIPDEEITAGTKDQLIECCKARMEELGGQIDYFAKLR